VHCHYRSHDSLTPTTVLCWLRRIETQFALNLEQLPLLLLPWKKSIWPCISNYIRHIYAAR
jgi:hypothetical protein